ncbi:MAG: 30S ribosomal protein S16 [bacterium]|nr:30S ribosomal protein S16 [bacterium]
MLKIRLQRIGRKHDPSFRIVLTDSRRGPKSGVCSEILGSYDARKGKPQLKSERIKYWLLKGVQVSETVHNLLVDAHIIEGAKRNALPSARKKGAAVPVKEEKKYVAKLA